jgi:flagellar biogenesis protein FliO
MPEPTSTPNRANPVRVPPVLIGLGILVIAVGFGLPRLATSQPSSESPSRVISSPTTGLEPRAVQPAPANVGLSLLRLVVALGVVCALCVVAARWMNRKPEAATAVSGMQVLASLRVGRCVVHLVRAGERRMLIGTDASGVKSLIELPAIPANAEETTTPV